MTLGYEVCAVLKELSYPQDRFPQMLWSAPPDGMEIWGWGVEWWSREIGWRPWVACPSEIEALEWLWKTYTVEWLHEYPVHGHSGTWEARLGSLSHGDYWACGGFQSVGDLILAIARHIESTREKKEVTL